MLGSSYFIGWCLTLLWVPRFGDILGRKKLFWGCMLCQTFLFVAMLFTKSLLGMTLVIGSFGVCNSIRVTIGFVYLMDLLPKKAQTPVTTVWCVEEALIYLIGTLWLWKIGKHTQGFEIVGLVWSFLSFVLVTWLPESPRFLVSTGQLSKAEGAFSTIAKKNKKELVWDESIFQSYFDKKQSSAHKESSNIPRLSFFLRQPKILINLIMI